MLAAVGDLLGHRLHPAYVEQVSSDLCGDRGEAEGSRDGENQGEK